MSDPFPSALDKTRLQEMNVTVAAPNKQPAGNRPGPKAPNTHAPLASGRPSDSINASQPGGGAYVAEPVKTAPTGKNKNRLH